MPPLRSLTPCIRHITFTRMRPKIVMDADCLIKLTKAGLKERVCRAWTITIPASVRRETVDQAPELPDAMRIRQNIADGLVRVASGTREAGRGEEAVLAL